MTVEVNGTLGDSGLDLARDEWPAAKAVALASTPIERLSPRSPAHACVLEYLLRRIDTAEKAMQSFYSRWQANEKRMQAYIDLPDYDKFLKEMNDQGKVPSSIPLVVPTVFATVSTIVTYLSHAFFGRKPIWQVSSYSSGASENARSMEIKLQYDSDHTRAIKALMQSFNDGQVYGVGVALALWKVKKSMRTVRVKNAQFDPFGTPLPSQDASYRQERVVYEGNEVLPIDPYMFFPDPRVPMTEVNKKGEFVFWRRMDAKHILLREEAEGNYKWVKEMSAPVPHSQYFDYSSRALRAGGEGIAGYDYRNARTHIPPIQVDQGTCEIIPAELGLGESEKPEKWLFTILNKSQIVQAEPFLCDHDMHPVSVAEPYTQGHCFGNLGITDYANSFQDVSSFLINSHMDNVKKSLNDMFLVDPSMIEMQDLKTPGPGKLIRLKRAAFGQDVRNAVQQFSVNDVTRGNIADLDVFSKISQIVTGVNENMMGAQDSGGRKTATEVRTSSEAAVSRLAYRSRLISAQFMVDLTEQMALNNIQFLSESFFISVLGKDGLERSIWISPEMLVGDYYFPVHDGTLPLDRVALLDVWREVMGVVLQDPQLRQTYDVTRMFEFVAELGGAKNLDGMRMSGGGMPPPQVRGEEEIDRGVGSGNMVPVGEFAGAGEAGRRLAEGIF